MQQKTHTFSLLQAALLKEGCYCGEMDEEDFIFGSGTTNAILTFQAMKSMPETGIADDATWAALGIHAGGGSAADAGESSVLQTLQSRLCRMWCM